MSGEVPRQLYHRHLGAILSHVLSVGRGLGANSTASGSRRGFFNEAPSWGSLFAAVWFLIGRVTSLALSRQHHHHFSHTPGCRHNHFLVDLFFFYPLPPLVASFCASGELVLADLAPRHFRPRALWHCQLVDLFFPCLFCKSGGGWKRDMGLRIRSILINALEP